MNLTYKQRLAQLLLMVENIELGFAEGKVLDVYVEILNIGEEMDNKLNESSDDTSSDLTVTNKELNDRINTLQDTIQRLQDDKIKLSNEIIRISNSNSREIREYMLIKSILNEDKSGKTFS